MNLNVVDCGYTKHARLLLKHMGTKIPVQCSEEGLRVELGVDNTIGKAESYRIMATEGGFKIVGSDEAGLYYGIGKFLHSAVWTENGFTPKETDGVISPACSFRATYYSVHFYNWYHMAPLKELEDYLETILILQERTGHVRSIDIATELGYSKPSVSRAVGILKSGGFITVEPDGQIVLTKLGLLKAREVYDRHLLITKFLHEVLGVSEENTNEDACKIEHVISAETYEKLNVFVENYLKD